MNATRLLRAATLLLAWAGQFATTSALGWGSEGHEGIALVAERLLTPEARSLTVVQCNAASSNSPH